MKKILLTGATGYVGKRLLPVLVRKGFRVICLVRDASRLNVPTSLTDHVEVVEGDLLHRETLGGLPGDLHGAYYLIHSMASATEYQELERTCAINFREFASSTGMQHVIYLSGMINEEILSEHLASRKMVEDELGRGTYHLTTLRAGIIIGSGSASFEIIRDLVEKLPVMITPKWLHTRCQPIGIADVITFLERSLFCEEVYDKNFDIGGSDILSYKEMLLRYARIRGMKRYIYVVPVMTPRLSSYWLFFITRTSYKLAVALVKSMKVEVICRDDNLNKILDVQPVGYDAALQRTLAEIEENQIVSSWKDALSSGDLTIRLSDFLVVPTHGCFADKRTLPISDRATCIDNVWRIGGDSGWYYATWLWKLRGFLDKLFGGVGLRRGRTSPTEIATGDAIDFWRVLYADRDAGRLLLFAEMKLPGEAWLEFEVSQTHLSQTATFRPKGLLGRLYWYAVSPFHGIIFRGMINRIGRSNPTTLRP